MKDFTSIVIITSNRKEETLCCLSSINSQSCAKNLLEIILVDNASSDGTVFEVKRRYPSVKIFSLKENIGFPGAINLGVSKARGDTIMILQSDTVLDSNFFKYMFQVIKSHPECGVFGPLVYYHDRPKIVEKAYGKFNLKTLDTIGVGVNHTDGKYKEDFEVPVTVFCGLLIRKSTFEIVGHMDDRFYIYFEDNDFFFRCYKHHIRFRFVPQAKLWHRGGKSMGKESALTTYYLTRNKLLLYEKFGYLDLTEHMKNIRYLFSSIILSFISRHKKKQYYAISLGMFDFYNSRFGRCRYTI